MVVTYTLFKINNNNKKINENDYEMLVEITIALIT